MITDLITYIVNTTGNSQAVEHYINSKNKEDLVQDGKYNVSRRCIEFLFGKLISNAETRQQFDTYLQQAYKVFKENTGNASDEETRDLFFQEISAPYIKYIEKFTSEVFNNSNITQYLETTNDFKNKKIYVTGYVLITIAICFAVMLGGTVAAGAANNDVKSLIVTIIVLTLLSILCGLGGGAFLYLGNEKLKASLQNFAIGEDLLDFVIDNPRWRNTNAEMADVHPIDLQQLQDSKLPLTDLADIVIGQIEFKTISDTLKAHDDVPDAISALIISFVFDMQNSEKLAKLLSAQHVFMEEFPSRAAPALFQLKGPSQTEDAKYEVEPSAEHKTSTGTSLRTPLLTAQYASANYGNQTQSEPRTLYIDIQENPGNSDK